MPSTWKISPEEFHKIYLANTDAFYKAAGSALAKELDEFMTRCALGLWSRAGSIGQQHVNGWWSEQGWEQSGPGRTERRP